MVNRSERVIYTFISCPDFPKKSIQYPTGIWDLPHSHTKISFVLENIEAIHLLLDLVYDLNNFHTIMSHYQRYVFLLLIRLKV